MLKYINLGLNLVMPAFVGLVIGVFLDNIFRTGQLLTVVFLFLGILSGLWSLVKAIIEIEKEE